MHIDREPKEEKRTTASPLGRSLSPANAGSLGKPTQARQWMIVFAVTLAVITYVHRVCISQAAPTIQRELELSKEQMAFVFTAFTFAYAAFEIPGGWLSDWIGPRRVLMSVVMLWSLFTAVTGWAWNLTSLVVFSFPVWDWPSGLFSHVDEIVYSVAASQRASAGAGLYVAGCALGRRADATDGGSSVCLGFVALGVRSLRVDRRGLGGLFLPLVP